METRRSQRVADLLQEEIARILQREVKDPRIGFVTITAVRVSADLKVAKVYYTTLVADDQRNESAKGLTSAVPFIRHEVAHRLRLKTVPELRFLYDESLDRAFRIDEILEDSRHEPEDPDR
ncbi:MAG: 30S ribosome-binding factor RbfA [Deferrisomatales bacterium]